MALSNREQKILEELERQFDGRRRLRIPAMRVATARWLRAHRWVSFLAAAVGFTVMVAMLQTSLVWSFAGFLLMLAGVASLPISRFASRTQRRLRALFTDGGEHTSNGSTNDIDSA